MVTSQHAQKIKHTKNENYRLLLMNGIKTCNLIQEDHNLVIPSSRINSRLTFNEFKEKIINGEYPSDIIKQYDKKSIFFYCSLLLGKINLTKEQLIKEYETGLSLDEIGDNHKIPRENMTHLRDFYGIKRKGARFIERIQNEKPISEETKQIIIGSLLGDGCICKTGDFREKHSLAQEQYLKWKAEKLGHIIADVSRYDALDKRNGEISSGYLLRTITHTYLLDMEKKFYIRNDLNDRVKIIPEDIANYLNPLVLAIWFMDDGYTDWGYRNGTKPHKNSLPSCFLCTDCFQPEEIFNLIIAIKKIFNINAQIYMHTKSSNRSPSKIRIKFNTIESQKFIKIISEHMQKELLYKINEDEYIKYIKQYHLNKVIS